MYMMGIRSVMLMYRSGQNTQLQISCLPRLHTVRNLHFGLRSNLSEFPGVIWSRDVTISSLLQLNKSLKLCAIPQPPILE